MARRRARPGRIGPNAVIRLAEALEGEDDPTVARRVFARAGQAGYLTSPPTHMIPAADYSALCRALFAELDGPRAHRIARHSGELTGDYLLSRRIPAAFQALLRRLPTPLAARALAVAISGHAWTFIGDGAFAWRGVSGGLSLVLTGSPACRGLHAAAPVCDAFAATFGRIFSGALGRPVVAAEVACAAMGERACRFEVRWREG